MKIIKNIFGGSQRKRVMWSILALIIIIIAAGIGGFIYSSGSEAAWKDKKQPILLKDVILSDSSVTLFDGTDAKLRLVMTKGHYYDEAYAGAGGGTYAENYNGSYELQLLDQRDTILSAIDLNSDWDNQNINFNGPFAILFADYNDDKCPDFSIGTYGSSNMNLYYLYTITANNTIKRICQSEIVNATKEWSVVFQHELQDKKYRFFTDVYNNADGETHHNTYYFEINNSTEIAEESKALGVLFGEPHVYYFKNEYSGEDYDSDGLPDQARLVSADSNTKKIEVTFGNGDLLELRELDRVTRDFKLLGADLNGNGVNEIIILSDTDAQGGDGAYSLSVYEKQDGSYKAIPLPEQYGIDSGFNYTLKWDGTAAKIFDGGDKELITLDHDLLQEHYYRIEVTTEWDNLQGKAADPIRADGICDAVIDTTDNKTYLMLKQYMMGPIGVHADCIGYVVTQLQLNVDNSWEIAGVYYLPD